MSTQQAPTIDFSVAQGLTSFQLLELPDELLSIITDSGSQTLELKSEATSSHAVLCTHNKTFLIRSVQTSNSLFVVQPAVGTQDNEDSIPQYGVQAISSCKATLELSKSSESALPYLRKALPVYSSRDLNISAAVKSSFKDIAHAIPLSHGEIETGWKALCAFEQDGASFRPTAAILLDLWKAILVASVAESIDLGSALLVGDLWKTIKDEDYPKGLFDALLHRIEDESSMEVDSDTEWATIDKTRCSRWLAALLLETQATGDQAIEVSSLQNVWKDNLPESWRETANLDLVQDIVLQPSPGTVALKPEQRLSGAPVVAVQAAETKAPTKARKWHEKFKKGRT